MPEREINALLTYLAHARPLFRIILRKCCARSSPVNFIDEYGRRWAYVAAFIIFANVIVAMLEGQYIWDPVQSMDNAWKLNFNWLKGLVPLLTDPFTEYRK